MLCYPSITPLETLICFVVFKDALAGRHFETILHHVYVLLAKTKSIERLPAED